MSGPDPYCGETRRLAFFLSYPHPCGYLEREEAISLLADPAFPMQPQVYEYLLEQGFRRNGGQSYRPHCRGCHACVPVRLPVTDFHWSRNLKRVWNRNQDLTMTLRPALFRQDHFELYADYLATRHPGGPMENPDEEGYMGFLTAAWLETLFVEFRQGEKLLMVAVMDMLPHALSAVYTFFDPREAPRSLGTFAILYQVTLAQRWGLPHLYLGYWIAACRKMRYKARFHPMEGLQDGDWGLLDLPR